MAIQFRVGYLKVLVGVLLTSALLVGPFAPPASAAGPTTNCLLTAKSNPSTVGQPATFEFFAAARLVENLPPSPSGVVTFLDGLGGGVLGVAILFPAALKDNNFVDFSTSSLSIGDHTIYAVLVGLSGPCPITPSASQHVNPPPASPSNTDIASSANPSSYQQNLTFTASVARQGRGAVAGTAQFQADGADLGVPQNVDGGGHASVNTSALAVGSHSVTAAFTSSNPNTLGSSGALAGGQMVQRADTQTGATTPPPTQQPQQSPNGGVRLGKAVGGVGAAGESVGEEADGERRGLGVGGQVVAGE